MEIEDKYLAELIGKASHDAGAFEKENKTDNIISFAPRQAQIKLMDFKKKLIKERIDCDFGKVTWDTLPSSFKINLWSKGKTT